MAGLPCVLLVKRVGGSPRRFTRKYAMTRPLFKVLCCMLVAATALTSIVSVGAERAQAQASDSPLRPADLRLDPLYDTVLLWSQDRNPPFYVYQWNIYLDGEFQTSLRTTRYNMPANSREGSYTIEAETRDGTTGPRSAGFTVVTVTPPPGTTPTPVLTPPPVVTPPPTVTPVPPTPGLIWGYDATPPSSDWARPPLGAVTTDPVYGSEVVRRTDATGTRFDRNTYSRRQAENADGAYFMTYHGSATYRVYNRATNELVRETDIHPNGEPQWHPTNPALLRHVQGNNSFVGDLILLQTNVADGETVVIADLTSRIQARMPTADYLIDRAEGSPSMDGNRYAWIVYDSTETPIGLVSYDLATDTILGMTVGLNESAYGRLDWVSMSPTGTYVMAGYEQGTLVYNADLTDERVVNLKADHSDIALDAFGRDAYVYIDFSSGPDAGYLVSVDLESLDRVRIFRVYGGANTSVHVSGKGFDKPGWVIVSTYNCKNPGAWTCEKVMAVEMVENGRVLNLAHTYNCGDSYWTETHAVVNRSFTRVYFNTDSGSCGIDAQVMELSVPEFD